MKNDTDSTVLILKGTLTLIEGILEAHDEKESQFRAMLSSERTNTADAVDARVKAEVERITQSLKQHSVQATSEVTRLKKELGQLNQAYQAELEAHAACEGMLLEMKAVATERLEQQKRALDSAHHLEGCTEAHINTVLRSIFGLDNASLPAK